MTEPHTTLARRRSIQGHGAAGIAAVALAILACYGTLAVAALLPLRGIRLALTAAPAAK